MKLNCGAERHHYSMFDVQCSMLDVHLLMCWTFEAGVFASNLGPNAFYRLEDGRSPRLNLLRSSSTKNLTGRGKEEG